MTDPAAPDLAIVERLRNAPLGLHCTHDAVEVCPEAAQCIEMLVAALDETHGWVRRIQDVMAGYIEPDGSDEAEALGCLIEMLDGPEQREIQGRSFAALAKVRGR